MEKPEVEKYDDTRFRVPFCIEQVTMGEGEDEIQQYRSRELFPAKYPNLAEMRSLIAKELNQDVGAYVYDHYDPGTQQTFQAMLAIDEIPEETKTAIKTVFPWVQSCLGYYYTKKTEILESNTPELVTWDFSQFNATKPDVSLGSIVGGA
jgi:hypothetical protein